jgi:ABC-type multidrug transport system fused ATPase/permease subunit
MNKRSGSILLYVIIIIGVVVGLVSLCVGYAYNRSRLIAAEEARYSLRNTALDALSQVMWNINGDTNGFDCAVEGSISSRIVNGCEVTIEPANARFNFTSFQGKRFVELVPLLAPEDADDADIVAALEAQPLVSLVSA